MAILKFSVHIAINPITWHISQFLRIEPSSENCINQGASPLVLVRGISKLSWIGRSSCVIIFLFASFLMSKMIYSPITFTVKLMSKCFVADSLQALRYWHNLQMRVSFGKEASFQLYRYRLLYLKKLKSLEKTAVLLSVLINSSQPFGKCFSERIVSVHYFKPYNVFLNY